MYAAISFRFTLYNLHLVFFFFQSRLQSYPKQASTQEISTSLHYFRSVSDTQNVIKIIVSQTDLTRMYKYA